MKNGVTEYPITREWWYKDLFYLQSVLALYNTNLLFFLKINFLLKIISGIPPECQTVWVQIILSGLVWVQTVCKDLQQTTKDVTGM